MQAHQEYYGIQNVKPWPIYYCSGDTGIWGHAMCYNHSYSLVNYRSMQSKLKVMAASYDDDVLKDTQAYS